MITVQAAIKRIQVTKGLTSIIEGIMANDYSVLPHDKGIGADMDKVNEELAKHEKALENCGSDWAYWSILGDVEYWRAIKKVMEAGVLGYGFVADIPAPDLAGLVVMDALSRTAKYGDEVLNETRRIMDRLNTLESKNVGLYGKYHITKSNGHPVDPEAEYFALRLDSHGDDPIHISACRHAIVVYAHMIRPHLPRLADDILVKWGEGINVSKDKLTASEAVYGVLAWMSTRPGTLEVGETHSASTLAELANQFCIANSLQPPRENWQKELIHPS